MPHGAMAVDFQQRTYNPERMRKERLERAHAAMEKYGFGAMILYDFDNHRYLGYYSIHQYARRRLGAYVLLIRGAGYPYVPVDEYSPTRETVLMPWLKDRMKLKTSRPYMTQMAFPQQPDYWVVEWDKTAAEIKSFLVDHGVADMPVGIDYAGFHMTAACQRAGIQICDGSHVMAAARMIKTEDELHCIEMAGTIAEGGYMAVCRALHPGVTELEMAGVAANAMYRLGADEFEGPSFVVCSGERTSRFMPGMATDRIVRPGDLFVMDLNGVGFQGYRTCFYRTFVVGDKPTDFQKDLYRRSYEGLKAMTESIKPGITNQEAQKSWLDKGREKGLWGAEPKWPAPGYYFIGSAGHHLGLQSGDPGPGIPGISEGLWSPPAPGLVIEKNMVFATEVGCHYWDGSNWARDGVKLEHVGRVTDTAFESFYRFPEKDLIAVGLPGVY